MDFTGRAQDVIPGAGYLGAEISSSLLSTGSKTVPSSNEGSSSSLSRWPPDFSAYYPELQPNSHIPHTVSNTPLSYLCLHGCLCFMSACHCVQNFLVFIYFQLYGLRCCQRAFSSLVSKGCSSLWRTCLSLQWLLCCSAEAQ